MQSVSILDVNFIAVTETDNSHECIIVQFTYFIYVNIYNVQ